MSSDHDAALPRSRPPRYQALSDTEYTPRACMRCRKDFASSGIGNRTCPKCLEYCNTLSRRDSEGPLRVICDRSQQE